MTAWHKNKQLLGLEEHETSDMKDFNMGLISEQQQK